MRVFGSIVRGEARAESDLDLLVDLEPGRSMFDLGGLQFDLEQYLGMKVDVVTEKGLRRRIREVVLREATSLLETGNGCAICSRPSNASKSMRFEAAMPSTGRN